jgi:hypothetical protein
MGWNFTVRSHGALLSCARHFHLREYGIGEIAVLAVIRPFFFGYFQLPERV